MDSYRCDSVAYWAVQGGSGWLNLLRQLQRDGIQFPEQCINDLKGIGVVLENVIRRAEGRDVIPLPGGLSGAIARHFDSP